MLAHFHLPGLFEFYEFYKLFITLFYERREYFYDWCKIGSIYGAPDNTLWGGGRIGIGDYDAIEVLEFFNKYGISLRLTFSNSLISNEHLDDLKCNNLCELFNNSKNVKNGVIIYSDLLLDYIKSNYPNLYFVSSTTKVITDFNKFTDELMNPDYNYVVPDFRLNKCLKQLSALDSNQKKKVEFLVNECCYFGCTDRKECYENISYQNLGIDRPDYQCKAPDLNEGYSFSKAMQNPGFISIDDINNIYMPMGFNNFKIEGRGLGSALILEFILYYMTKPQYHINVREALYLNNMLDLF